MINLLIKDPRWGTFCQHIYRKLIFQNLYCPKKHCMKKPLILLLTFLPIIFLYAQKEIGIAEQHINYVAKVEENMKKLEGPFINDPLFYTKGFALHNGRIEIYDRMVIPAMLASGKKSIAGVGIASGYTLVPSLGIVSFASDLSNHSSTIECINLYDTWNKKQPYDYTLTTNTDKQLGSSETDKRLSILEKMHSVAFEPFDFKPTTKVIPTMGLSGFTSQIVEKHVESVNGFRLPHMIPEFTESQEGTYHVKYKELFDKVTVFDKVNVYNPIKDQWTSLAGEIIHDKENKWSEYRKMNFITTNNQGQVINNVPIDYQFTQQFNNSFFVSDDQDSTLCKLVFPSERRLMLHKYDDPDHTKYDLTVLNADGSLDFHHKFNFGEKAYELSICYSYMHNGTLYLMGVNGYSNGNLVLFEADKKGVRMIGSPTNTTFGNGNGRISSQWKPYGYKIVNGQLFVWGEERKVVQEASTDFQTNKPIPEIINFINFAVLQIDLDQKRIVGQYLFHNPNKNLTKPTLLEELLETDHQLILFTSETKRNRKAVDDVKLNFFTNNQYTLSGMDYKRITRPVLYSIDYVQKKPAVYTVSVPDYINLYPRNSWIREGNDLYFIGIKDEQNPGEVTYMVVRVAL